jgi:tRNA-specific 2-thiouridylase
VWLDWARKHGFEYIATGHYARVKEQLAMNNEQKVSKRQNLLIVNCALLISKDTDKDQTYFLHQLNQEQLSQVMFPIGGYTKPQVRALAKKFKLPTALKAESMGICFVGEVPMKDFLTKKVSAKPGTIRTTSGEVIGKHDGLPFYTIGQRHGFDQAGGSRPLYVVAKDEKKKELIVGFDNDPLLYKKDISLTDIHFTGSRVLEFPLACQVRLRHRQPLQKAVLEKRRKEFALVCAKAQRAPTPGQFAVFYIDGECVGGGVIM